MNLNIRIVVLALPIVLASCASYGPYHPNTFAEPLNSVRGPADGRYKLAFIEFGDQGSALGLPGGVASGKSPTGKNTGLRPGEPRCSFAASVAFDYPHFAKSKVSVARTRIILATCRATEGLKCWLITTSRPPINPNRTS